MPQDRYSVELAPAAGPSVEGVFLLDRSSRPCRLTLQWGSDAIRVEASDYFEALCLIRVQLEPKGLRPVCYGASKNVYPSGMARDMGSGLKAYRTRTGERARQSDLVRIFDTGPDVEPVSVEEQRAYHDQWLASVGFPNRQRPGPMP
jgi:hypothetical protein